MLLTLEVVSANGEALGAGRRKTIGPEGAQIGRAKENDWVIPDQYISRVNARIHYMDGAFYIEGLGRNPLAMGDANNTVLNNQLLPLRHGERFFLDQYEIRVTISGQTIAPPFSGSVAPTRASLPLDDPFAAEPRVVVRNPRSTTNIGIGDVVIDSDGPSTDGNLDPLQVLQIERSNTVPPRHIDIDQRPVIEDAYIPPAPLPTGESSPKTGIPEDWLNDPTAHSPFSKVSAPADRPAHGQGHAQSHVKSPRIPEEWNKTGLTQLGLVPPGPTKESFAPNDSTFVEDLLATEPAATPRVEPPRPQPSQLGQSPWPEPQRAPQAPSRPVHGEPAEAQSSLGQLLRAAGLPSAQMTPEIAAEIGEALRIVVQGVMDVLRARAEIKSELRMAMTRMQSQENNPLKFSPNVESALHTLLVERNRGYMPTTRAFQEAFNDIRNHQMAVMYGFRVAFDSLIAQFHPDQIETQMEAQGRRGGLLNIGNKARFRDYYGEMFEHLTKDPEACFRRLFNEPFTQAYEEQLEQLALAARRPKSHE